MSEPAGGGRHGAPARLWRWIDALARSLFLLAATPTLLALFARQHWFLDNLTSFAIQYTAASMVCVAAFLLLRRPVWTAVACAVVAINIAQTWPPSTAPVSAVGKPLKLISVNVKTSNRDFDRLLALARAEKPDLLLVIETDSGWVAALESLRDQLPHVVARARDDNFGLVLLSRVPFDEAKVIEIPEPTIVGRVTHDGRSFTVIGTHPLPPVRSGPSGRRNTQLQELAGIAREEENSLIVAGDLNVSPWSPHFRELIRESGLRDSRAGFGVQATWPSFFPLLGTPIDHVLISPDLAVIDRSVGPDIGSDHFPVVAAVAFRRAARVSE
jgi:endonuclease/exonuclease/phosphatase (EEP) superfamily protein YafD